MNTRPNLYRSTLVAAALAIGCLGAAAANAHEHWGHDRDDHRGYYAPHHGWHERGDYRGYGEYRPAWRSYYREPVRYYAPGYVVPGGYYGPVYDAAPVVVYPPAPGADVVYGNPNVSVMIHLPL